MQEPRYLSEFVPPLRLLMGAGPVNVHPRVSRAMSAPLVTHLDPAFADALDDVRTMLRLVFRTENELTWPIAGTGTASMEAALAAVLEPGDKLVAGTNGAFTRRAGEVARALGADVIEVSEAFGAPVDPEAIRRELARHEQVKAVIICHGETSTGVLTPLVELARVAHEADALFIVDAVTTLGGVELLVDEWEIDVCFSATQKCLGCPPGLGPITLSQRAIEAMADRQTPVAGFYLNVGHLGNYFRKGAYHHTAPVPMIYALREALRIVLEEGLEERWRRHSVNAAALRAGLRAIGLELCAAEGYQLPSLTTARVPDFVDGPAVRQFLLDEHGIEIVGGLGDQAKTIWRIGLMGYNSTSRDVATLLVGLEEALAAQGFEFPPGAGLAAARDVLRQEQVRPESAGAQPEEAASRQTDRPASE